MELDWQVCSQARLTRDARFDGKFFIGVFTSGVYCRSILPCTAGERKKCSLLSNRRRSGGGRFSALSALPTRMFTWDPGLGGNSKYRFEGAAAD
jgi:hypothetical protein